MADRYFTSNQKRRDAADPGRRAAAGLAPVNGIDFVDVDAGLIDPATNANRPTLTVKLFTADVPAQIDAIVTGGVGAAVRVGSVNTAGDSLTVVLQERGDTSSIFTLHLVRAKAQPVPPSGFDPLLSSVEFSFQPRAVRQDDCPDGPRRRADDAPEPRIDYLAKDWQSFRQIMLDRLASISPAWTERSPADLGAVLVELLAHAGDHLSYYQDAVATEAYLGTARRRVSVRRHARLLDYFVHEGCNARAWISIEGNVDGVKLERGKVKFLTRFQREIAVPAGQLGAALETFRPVVFELLQDKTLHRALGRIDLYTFGDDIPCLAKGATRATLDDRSGAITSLSPPLAPGDVLLFEEVRGPATGLEIDADPSHRHAVRLTRVTPYEDASDNGHKVIDIEWRAEDALPFALCVKNEATKEPLSVARGNVVLADHGLTVGPEALPEAPAAGRYRPALRRRGLTYSNALPADLPPATRSLAQDPHTALPAIALDEGATPWDVEHDLLRSKPADRAFVVEMDDRGSAQLRFGDGVLGARPGPSTALSAVYRIGNGAAGNVGAGAIAHIVVTDSAVDTSGIESLTNPVAAAGGVDPETIDHVRVAAPQSFRVQERAVTERDHAAAAERFPGVRKAAAFRRFLGSFDAHVIAVARDGGAPVDDAFKAGLRSFLEGFRLSGTEIMIEPPVLVPVDITLLIKVADGHLRNSVHAALLAAFSELEFADGRRGFFHPEHFSFGQPIYLGQVVRAAMDVGGVASVDTTDGKNVFRRRDRRENDIERGRIHLGPIEIATSGTVDFHLEGGL